MHIKDFDGSSYLVDGFKHFIFSIIYGIVLPIDYYFSRCLKPPTRYTYHRFYIAILMGSLWVINHVACPGC
jgi:hypothetical protein